MAHKSTMAPGETSSSVDATSCDPQSATPNIHSAQPQLDTFPVNDTASHLYDDGAFQLYQTTATFGVPADHTALLDQPAPLPAIDEGEALDPMLIVDHGEPLRNPLLSATIYDNTSFGMTRNDGHDLLHDSPLPAIVYGNASFDMVSIDNGSLFAGPPLQLPGLSNAMHFASNIIQNQSFQLPGENTSALRIPPCTISANSFNLNPSPPLFANTSLWDQAPLTGPFDIGLSAPLATFGTWDTLQIPAAQSSGVSPGVSAHSFPITNSSADAGSGLPQPSRQEELGTPPLASIPRKRALDDTQSSPIPSSKRLATIRPKSLPAQTRSTGDSFLKSGAKLANIPPHMVTTWRAHDLGFSNSSEKRTRSTKVCLRCQAMRQKCDGEFPCRRCRNSGQRRQLKLYMDLPCIDADPKELNYFDFFIPFYLRAFPSDTSKILKRLEAKEKNILEAGGMLKFATGQYIRKTVDAEMLCALFSYFSLTGIPICEASTVFVSPPVSPWRVEKLTRCGEHGLKAIDFCLAVTQKQNLAKLAHLSERETEIWLSLMSDYFFVVTAKLLSKVTHGKASPAEKLSFGCTLVVLLFVCQVRNTYVLQAAERAMRSRRIRNRAESLFFVAQHILKSSEQRKHLRLWTKHWLRKLYSDRDGNAKSLAMVGICTLVSSLDIPSDFKSAMEGGFLRKDQFGNVAEEDKVEQDIFEESDEESDNESSGGDRAGGSGNAVCEHDSEERDSWEDDCRLEGFSKGGFGEARDDIGQDAADDNEDDDDGGEGVVSFDGNATHEDFKDVTDVDEEDGGGAKTYLHPSLVRLICDMLTMRAEQCRGAINVPALRKELDILACNDLVKLLKLSPMLDENDTNPPPLNRFIQLEANIRRIAILSYTERYTSKRVVKDIVDARTNDVLWNIFDFLATIWIFHRF